MNQPEGGLLDGVFQLMEEEIFHYHLLAEELKKESQYLRKSSTDALTESLNSIEIHTTAIRKAHESVQKAIEKILAFLAPAEPKKTLSNLLPLLSAQDSQRIKSYQRTVGSLKKWVAQINTRNKTFIQESLTYWKDLFSLLTQPLGDSQVYVQNGKKQPPAHPPYSLNRKV